MKTYYDKDKAKFKAIVSEMSLRNKLKHYWDCYHIHFIVVFLLLICLISLILSINHSRKLNTYLQIVVQDQYVDILTPQFEEFSLLAGFGNEITIQTAYSLDTDPTGSEFMHLISVMSTDGMDIAVLEEQTVDYLLDSDGVLNHFTIYPLPDTTLEASSDNNPLFLLIIKDSIREDKLAKILPYLILSE